MFSVWWVLVSAAVITSGHGCFARSRIGSDHLRIDHRSDSCGASYNGMDTTYYYGADGYHNYEILQIYNSTERGIDVQLSLCTTERDGLLFRVGSPTESSSLCIQMKNRFLQVLLQEGDWKADCILSFDNQSISDSRPHTVQVQLTTDFQVRAKILSNNLTIQRSLDAGKCITKMPTLKEVDLAGDPIDWKPDPVLQNNFKGCLRDIRLNGKRLDQVATLEFSQGTSSFCDMCSDLCPPSFIMISNDQQTSDQQCVCPPNKEAIKDGTYCRPSCKCHTCHNGGTCQVIEETVTCECSLGYFGDQCQFEFNVCDNGPCKNNGTCHQNHSVANGFICQCCFGYEGEMCEVEITPLNKSLDGNGKLKLWIVIFLAVLAIILMFGLLLAFVRCLLKRTKGQTSNDPPSVTHNQSDSTSTRCICGS